METALSRIRSSSKYLLPFTLLSDGDKVVRKVYGVSGHLLPGRVTFVIDGKGLIRHIFSSQTNIKAHVDEAMNILKTLT